MSKEMTHQDHVDANYKAFKKKLVNRELDRHFNKFALMVNGEIAGTFDTWDDAFSAGELLEGKVFSIQEVTKETEYLGCFSNALV